MSPKEGAPVTKKRECTLDEALEIVGSGLFTNMLALTCGFVTLGGMAMSQTMYYVLPVIKCELELSPAELGLVPSIGYAGALLSVFWMGSLMDLCGRWKILLIGSTGTCISSVITAFAPDFTTLVILMFITGFLLGGTFANTYVYLGEFCGAKIRSQKLIYISIVSSLSNTISPGIAWLIMWLDISIPVPVLVEFKSWRLFMLANAVPLIAATAALVYFPESPKFLLSKGREEEAMESLRRAYAGNHRLPKDTFPVERIKLDSDDTTSSEASNETVGIISSLIFMYKQIKEIFSPPLLVYTVICSLDMIAVLGLYSLIYIWVPEEANRLMKYSQSHKVYEATFCEVMEAKDYSKLDNCSTDNETYILTIVIGIGYSILSVVMLFLIRVFKLKYLLGANVIITGAIGFAMLFSKSLELTLAALGLMTAILGTSQPAVYASVIQFFPTRLRGSATAACIVFGRLAVPIGSPLYAMAMKSHCRLVYWILAGSLAVIGIISFLTPNKKKELTSSEG